MTKLPFRTFLLMTFVALSSTAADDEQAALAKQHFARAVALSDSGDLAGAIAEFERAYETRPHPAVLFNLGKALSAIGKPVEAVRALREYLRGSKSVDAKRRGEVAALIASNEKKLGKLELELEPQSAEISVDGRPLGRPPFEPIELAAGPHAVIATAQGHEPIARQVIVVSSESTKLRLALAAIEPPPPRELGFITVSCPMPDVNVVIDGNKLAKTPISEPLAMAPGVRRVLLMREGYESSEVRVSVTAADIANVSCDLRPDGQIRPGRLARLQIRASESDVHVVVDGRPFHGQPLPPGLHAVHIERAGFFAWRGAVDLTAGNAQTLNVKLRPTPEYVSRYVSEVERRRYWAIVAGASGLLVGGAGVATYVWNNGRYDDWRKARDQLSADIAKAGLSQPLIDQGHDLDAEATSIDRADAIAVGLGAVGAGLLAVGGVLWLGAPDPERYGHGARMTVGLQRANFQLRW